MIKGNYEIIRMPTVQDELNKTLEEYMPFLDAMYGKREIELFGELNFLLDYWLFLWDNDTGFFLTKRDEKKNLKILCMLTKYKDIWHGRVRVEIHKIAIADDISQEQAQEEVKAIFDYLKSIRSLLGFDFLYYNTKDNEGNEYKFLVHRAGG